MHTIYWHMNATIGGVNCAHEHGLVVELILFLGVADFRIIQNNKNSS